MTTWDFQGKGDSPEWNAALSVNSGLTKTLSDATGSYALFVRANDIDLYVVDSYNDRVVQYQMSKARDVSSATFVQFKAIGITGQFEVLFFSPEGTKMYVGSSGASTSVRQYSLSTAWDISTASYVQNKTFSYAKGLYISPDGLNLYTINTGNDTHCQYSLSVAWDISTATLLRSTATPVDGYDYYTYEGIEFSSDGRRFYTVANHQNYSPEAYILVIRQYDLSTAWDISTATQLGSYVQSWSTYDYIYGEDIRLSSDGSSLFTVDSNTSPATLRQFNLTYSSVTKNTSTYSNVGRSTTLYASPTKN